MMTTTFVIASSILISVTRRDSHITVETRNRQLPPGDWLAKFTTPSALNADGLQDKRYG